MTILHILDHSVPLFSGYSFRSESIVRFQQRLGLRPVVLTSPRHGSARDGIEAIDGVSYYRTRQRPGWAPGIRDLGQIARIAGRIVEVARIEQVQLLHAHSPTLNGLPALWAGRRLGIPVVYEARAFWEDAAVDHGTTEEGSLRYRLSRALETWLAKRVDRVVTICEGMRKDLLLRGVKAERIVVVPNGVDVDAFQPKAPSETLARAIGLNGGPVFGFIGSFYRYEGLRFLVEAMPRVRHVIPGTRLLLVGGGPDEPSVRAVAEGLGDGVILAGRVPHRQILDYYSLIDVFVCPRRRMRLTELVTPLKPLEAMAMGKPVLASDVGGHRELIQHEVTGLLFPAENQEDFVAAAVRLGGSPDLRRRLGQAGHDYVTTERTWQQIVSRYKDIYAACG